MDENVMGAYASQSTEPFHYIQYDQGIVNDFIS